MKWSLILIVLSMMLAGCIPTEKACTVDAECVPAECCHAKDTVNNASAPDCKGILCTAECVAGTIDCGQAKLQCVKGKCKAVSK
ncbi:MAG: hypothetical protein ABIA37_05560 [Candidatus Woesearchaeota archaeon]